MKKDINNKLDKLEDINNQFGILLEEFTTGNKEVTVKDLDHCYRDLKSAMIKLRVIAISKGLNDD